MDRRELTDCIKRIATEIGFTKVGVTSAAPFDKAADRLDAWVSSGAHGLMTYMERGHEKRRNVNQILPNAKSILCLALNYYHDENYSATPVGRTLSPSEFSGTDGLRVRPTEEGDGGLKISRYAWGDDYHKVIGEMLPRLLDKIKRIAPETEGRFYVDTGPVLEKAVAERAGIGWIGKHTNVITRELGSWVFLAEIILNLELNADNPAEDLCGTCTACIDACPTDALNTPYRLDATKCISYLTIELKPEHPIPPELAPNLDGWLYGCDICQDVCPWNRFQQQTEIKAFAPREENLILTKEKIEMMEQEEFSKRFRKSPVKRTKLAGLKRNVRALKL
ncbi:MAG: tRNA epoxyqueuosine(34) reductase QueG [bacterium]